MLILILERILLLLGDHMLEQQLFSASYNGIPFLVRSSEVTHGRKNVTHEFPNKKWRYVEDLGENLRTFNIKAVVTGSNYFTLRQALDIALSLKLGSGDNSNLGVLIHPFYGLCTVVVKSYTISEDIQRFGDCAFDISFQEAYPNILPFLNNSTVASIFGYISELQPVFSSSFSDSFKVSYPFNIKDAGSKCSTFSSSMTSSIATIPVSQELNSQFKRDNDSFNSNRILLVQAPDSLSSNMMTLMDSMFDLTDSPSDGYSMFNNLFNYGDDDRSIYLTTPERIERYNNRLALNSLVKGYVLMNLYKNALLVEYLDDQQLQSAYDDLESKYRIVYDNSTLSDELKENIKEVRTNVRSYLDNIRVNISKVISDKFVNTSLSKLLYDLYNDFDNEDEIIQLNDMKDPTYIDGTIKVLSTSVEA